MLSVAALAPLIDIFTILVVAVLKSSSAAAPPQLPEAQTELPLSALEQPVLQLATIDIGKDGIYFNGARVSSRTYWEKQDAPIIDEFAAETKGKVRVGKINVDANPMLSSKFNILSVPFLFIFDNGQMKESMPGGLQKHDLMMKMAKYV